MAVFVASVAITANRFKVPPVLPTLMVDLEVGMVTGGWLMSVYSLAGIILAIPSALLLARLGLRIAGFVAMGCAFVGAIVGALAANATVMLLGRTIEGVSFSLMAIMAPTAISMWFRPQNRGLPMGIWAAGVPVGNVIMFNIAYPLMSSHGWQTVWWFGAVLALGGLVLVVLVATSPTERKSRADNSPVPKGSVSQDLLNPSSWLLGLAFGAFGFSLMGYTTWLPAFLTDILQVEASVASSYASIFFLIAIPANITAGWILSHTQHRFRLLPMIFLITGFLFFWSFRLGSVQMAVPYMIVLGFASNFIPAAMFTLAPETAMSVDGAGLAVAILMVGSNVGPLVGPPTLGAILSTGNWFAGSICLATTMGIGTVIAWHLSRRLRGHDNVGLL